MSAELLSRATGAFRGRRDRRVRSASSTGPAASAATTPHNPDRPHRVCRRYQRVRLPEVNYGDRVRAVLAQAPATSSTDAASGEKSVSWANFESLQRQTADSIHSATANLEAQKADLEKLSGQVADLAAKVNGLRNATAAAPASPPTQNSRSAPPVGRPRPAVIAERKKPQAPKAGPISVGGAPLPPAPG
jgi:hypothetical protein